MSAGQDLSHKEKLKVIMDAVKEIKSGGIVVYPTETFYGIGADALNGNAVEMIFKLKGRMENKPLPLVISDIDMLELLGAEVNQASRRLMDVFWPGPLTLLLKVRKKLPAGIVSAENKVAVRISSSSVARNIAFSVASPITATSANISGGKSPLSISDIPDNIIKKVNLVIDAGTLNGVKGSTIVDANFSLPRIIREGEIPAEKIYQMV